MAVKKINPAKEIFVDPRKAIQGVLRRKSDTTIYFLYFFLGLLMELSVLNKALYLSPIFTSIVMFILAWPVGYLIASFIGWTLTITGRIINGKGNFHTLRKAYVWGMIPAYWITLVLVPFYVFIAKMGSQLITNKIAMMILLYSFIPVYILGIWATFSTADCIAIAQKYNSTTKAWINHLLSSILVTIAVGLLMLLFYFVMSFASPEMTQKATGYILGC